MNTRLFSFMTFIAIALFGAGCWGSTTQTPVTVNVNANPTSPPVSVPVVRWPTNVLVSTVDPTTYCNGANMDTNGFRATITKVKSVVFPADETLAQHVKSVVIASTSGMCQTVLKQTAITVSNGTVSIASMGGWAGVSIVLCSCKPEVEENLLRIPGITKVIWH